LTQTYFNRRVAAEDEVEAVEAVLDSGRVTLDLLLDAQRRRAEAESLYYRALVDYNRAIMRVHYRKGSLLEYNGVYLAEGPWPGKASFDALRRARQRDASTYLDYGFTRPDVISHGPYDQFSGQGELVIPEPTPAEPMEPTTPTDGNLNEEIIPLPAETTTSDATPKLEITPDDLAKLPAIDPVSTGIELANHTAAPVVENPFRQAIQKWSDAPLRQLPADQRPGVFPQATPIPQPQPATGPSGQPLIPTDESFSHHAPAGTAANPAVGQGAKR
jgi:hypothetical protein